AAVDRLPDATVHVTEIELVGPAGYAGHRVSAPAAERPEHAPAKSFVQRGELLLRDGGAVGRRAERRDVGEPGAVEAGRGDRERGARLACAHEEITARERRIAGFRRWRNAGIGHGQLRVF